MTTLVKWISAVLKQSFDRIQAYVDSIQLLFPDSQKQQADVAPRAAPHCYILLMLHRVKADKDFSQLAMRSS